MRMRPSPGGCCWRRNGWEAHLSEPRAEAPLLANWAGPRGEDPQGGKGSPAPAGGPPQLFSPSSCRSSFLLFGSAAQGGGRVTCPCLRGKGDAQLLAFCSATPPPRLTHVHKHTHTHTHKHTHTFDIWVAVPTAGAPASLNLGLICLGPQAESLGSWDGNEGWLWTHPERISRKTAAAGAMTYAKPVSSAPERWAALTHCCPITASELSKRAMGSVCWGTG